MIGDAFRQDLPVIVLMTDRPQFTARHIHRAARLHITCDPLRTAGQLPECHIRHTIRK